MRKYILLLIALAYLLLTPSLSALATSLSDFLPETHLSFPDSIKVSFWLDEVPWLKSSFQGTPLWQYLAFFIYLVIAYFFTRLLTAFLFSLLKKWLPTADNKLGKITLSLLSKPIRLIIFVLFLYIGLELYMWPEWITNILDKLFKLAVALSATYAFAKLVDVVFLTWKEKTHADTTFSEQIIPLLNRCAKYLVVFIGILMMAANLGINITSILTLGSVVALAVSLAAQDLLSNIIGGITIFLDKPFKIGDAVRIDGWDGRVEAIGLRSTRVRTSDGFLLTIPNKSIGNTIVANITSRPTIKTEINIGITYDTTAKQLQSALEIVRDIYASHPKTQNAVITFNKFEESSLNIQIVHWHKSDVWAAYMRSLEEMNLELKKRFDSAGVNFAFPTRTLYLSQKPEESDQEKQAGLI